MIEINLVTQESGYPLLTYSCEDPVDKEIYLAIGLLERVKVWLLELVEEDGENID